MSYSILSSISIGLAFTALALAVLAGISVCVRRRQWASRTFTPMLVVLLGAGAFGLLASAESDHGLQTQARGVVSLAASAERTARVRFGSYTVSVTALQRLSSALADEMRNNGAAVSAGVVRDGIRLQASLGYGTSAKLTLRPGLFAARRGHRRSGARRFA